MADKVVERWRNRVVPWSRACPKCDAPRGQFCRAVSEDDQLAPSGWTLVPPSAEHSFGVAHNERFRPE